MVDINDQEPTIKNQFEKKKKKEFQKTPLVRCIPRVCNTIVMEQQQTEIQTARLIVTLISYFYPTVMSFTEK